MTYSAIEDYDIIKTKGQILSKSMSMSLPDLKLKLDMYLYSSDIAKLKLVLKYWVCEFEKNKCKH